MLHIAALGYGFMKYDSTIRSVVHLSQGSLWDTPLDDKDVIIIYGLNPIMNELKEKIFKECKDGTIVVSNVFPFPNWQHIERYPEANVYFYEVGKGVSPPEE